MQVFPSFEAHAAAVGNSTLRATLLGKVLLPWTMCGLTLPTLRAQWGQAGAANLVEGTVKPGGVAIFLPTQSDREIRLNGRPYDAETIGLHLPGEEFSLASMGPHCWFAMHVPYEVLADWNGTVDTPIALSSRFIRVPLERAMAFRRVVEQLKSIVVRAPGALESPTAVNTTSRRLMEALREALCGRPDTTSQPGKHAIPRRQIVRKVMDSFDQRDDEPLTVTELASVAEVSERTLRAAFQEYFGMGPVRYLKLRTLNLARKALQDADPSTKTVTQIATEFGIWEFGRFAREYQTLFGELPSATLRQWH